MVADAEISVSAEALDAICSRNALLARRAPRYAGFGVSVVGIVAYRGPYFGVFDTLKVRS